MAVNSTAVWRARPSGSNTNGGGFDCSISAAATGSNGSLSGVTFTDATAASFTSGMAGSAINILGVGQYKIATYVGTTQITLGVGAGGSLPQLSGGYSWTVGAGQDYSQQNSAQVTQSGGTVSTTTTTLTDTGASFTSALIGNGIMVSGTSITTTFTYITAVPTSTTLTLQTSPGAAGTSVSYNIGGGWDLFTNTTSAAAWVQPGNIIYVLGSGTPNPASYTFDYTQSNTSWTLPNGSAAAGNVILANDPGTPGYKPAPNTTGGMPTILYGGTNGRTFLVNQSFTKMVGLWLVTHNALAVGPQGGNECFSAYGCAFDQNSFDVNIIGGVLHLIGCEIFSSVAPGSSGTHYALDVSGNLNLMVTGSNIHDTVGPGLRCLGAAVITGTIVAKCRGDGLTISAPSGANIGTLVQNNTIDGNAGNGIVVATAANGIIASIIIGNIISNQTTAGKYGISVSAGTAATNALAQMLCDFNTYYNNAANYNAINAGPHDTALGSNPYNGQSTEDYSLA